MNEEREPPPSHAAAAADARAGALRRFIAYLVKTYATVDPRSLGLFRIALGALLFEDVARRLPDLDAHYTNAGWLPNHFALFRPMSDHLFSVYLAFSTPSEVRTLVVVHLLVNVLLLVGYRTKLMQVLAALLITSLNSRNIMLENGGWVVLNELAVWSMFLPLGRRFSVDAWLASWRARREGTIEALSDRSWPAPARAPVVSLAVTALILQYATIYFFNVVHKTGRPWHDGTAVYYFFQQDRMVTSLGVWLRQTLPLSGIKLITWSTLVIESSICLLILLPVFTRYTRMVAWLLVCSLHLSIDAVVQLGPFSWAMVVMFIALIPSEAWDWLGARLRARRAERWMVVDPSDALALTLARGVKRLDRFEHVHFVSPEAAADAGLPELPADTVGRTLVVADREQVWSGAAAFRRLGQALPLRVPLGPRRFIARAYADRDATARFLGIDDLPGTDRGTPPGEPSGARSFMLGARTVFASALVLLLMVACTSQVLVENAGVPPWMKPKRRPEWMLSAVIYPRLFQGWSMFAPGPPTEDGRLVVDGRTADGRPFDPLTGKAPSFDVQPKDGFRMDQLWGDFHRRIADQRFSAYWQGVRDFILHHHELTGRPQDRVVAFDAWYVTEQIPPPGQRKAPPQRRKLFSWGVVR